MLLISTAVCYICSEASPVTGIYQCCSCGKESCSLHSLVCLECDSTYCTLCLPDTVDCGCESSDSNSLSQDSEYIAMVKKYTTLLDDEPIGR